MRPALQQKMNKQGNVLTSIIILVVLAAGITLYYFSSKPTTYSPKSTQPESTKSAEQTKTFQSSTIMKLSISVPADFEVIEKFNSVSVINNNEKILIAKNNTNLNNLDDYIKNSKNNLEDELKNKKDLNINGLQSTSGFINNEKVYLIYVSNTVYHISTSSEDLYDDLDQIAKSFKYNP